MNKPTNKNHEVVANTYEVTIKGTITKTIVVDAINQDEAEDKAHGMFNVTCDGPEYWQETVGTTKLIKEEV